MAGCRQRSARARGHALSVTKITPLSTTSRGRSVVSGDFSAGAAPPGGANSDEFGVWVARHADRCVGVANGNDALAAFLERFHDSGVKVFS